MVDTAAAAAAMTATRSVDDTRLAAMDADDVLDDAQAANAEGDEFSLAGDEESDEQPTPSAPPLPLDNDDNVLATTAPPVTTTATATAPPVATTTAPLAAATAKPMLRADATTLHTRLNQGSPLLLLSFAVICCGFLLLWVRKRRAGDAAATASPAAKSSKVQYSRIENKRESPFEDDGENDDDDDDDRADNWDDWEGGHLADEPHVTTNAYQTALYAHPNPFAAGGSASALSPPATPSQPQFQFAGAPRLPAPEPHLPRSTSTELHHGVVVSAPASSGGGGAGPGSNSSSDSYEVVTDDPALLHSSPFTSSKALSPKSPTDAEADKQQEADDLFSQFGMVPTFKKSAQPPAPSFLQTPAAPSRPQRPSAATPVSAAAASALFAAEMEDLSAAAASDEWGEDDEWVQGI